LCTLPNHPRSMSDALANSLSKMSIEELDEEMARQTEILRMIDEAKEAKEAAAAEEKEEEKAGM